MRVTFFHFLLSNIYYPSTGRGLERTFKRVATGIPFRAIDHLIDEFESDLERKSLGRKINTQP